MSVRYFAYGANMAADVMACHCPRHRLIGIAELRDHRLAFRRRSVRTGTGVADAMPNPGHSMWGVLYELDDADFASLDAKEGAGWAYDRSDVEVWPEGGAELVASVAYRVSKPEREAIPPSEEYASTLISAARARGLPPDYVRELEETVRRAGAP